MIYIHVPFCRSFCNYCDFYSEIADTPAMDRFAAEICREIAARKDEMDDTLKTLYFGGGTPTVLPLPVLTRILLALEEAGAGGPYEEFTLESNPEDIIEKGPSYLRNLKALGVNRMSLGVQSFDDGLLRWMNRRHDADRALRAIRAVKEAGFDNVSIDLIFGISLLSDEVWEHTIDTALETGVQHISCYQLTLEGDSKLAEMARKGDYAEASEEQCARQYEILCRKLAGAGFEHYEISNFALPGYRAVHNSGYWARLPYVGLGPSAHSFSGQERSWNSDNLTGYVRTREALSAQDAVLETIMLSLRTSEGIDRRFLHENCRKETVEKLLSEGALQRHGARYRIPEERMFTSDEIIRELV